jgi:cell division protein FtsN
VFLSIWKDSLKGRASFERWSEYLAGALMVEAGQFAGRSAAEAVAARLPGARISQQGRGRNASFRVALGPFTEVRAADFALERTLAAGLSGARIIVE